MKKYIYTFILGAIVGLLGGLQGNAGSLYILTGLLLFDIVKHQREAAGTTLLFTSVPLTLAAAYNYYKKGDINIPIAIILIFTATIFSFLGSKLNYLLSEKTVIFSIAITTLLSSIYFFRKGLLYKS